MLINSCFFQFLNRLFTFESFPSVFSRRKFAETLTVGVCEASILLLLDGQVQHLVFVFIGKYSMIVAEIAFILNNSHILLFFAASNYRIRPFFQELIQSLLVFILCATRHYINLIIVESLFQLHDYSLQEILYII